MRAPLIGVPEMSETMPLNGTPCCWAVSWKQMKSVKRRVMIMRFIDVDYCNLRKEHRRVHAYVQTR